MKDRHLLTCLAAVLLLMGVAVWRCEAALAEAEQLRVQYKYLGGGTVITPEGKEVELARFLPLTPISLMVVIEAGEPKIARGDNLLCTMHGRTVLISQKPVIETFLQCEDGRVLVVKGIQPEVDYYVVKGTE